MDVTAYDWQRIAQQTTGGAASHDSGGSIGIFYTASVEDKERTRVEGRACFKDVVMVEIRTPGQNKSVFHGRATDEFKRRFPRAWDAYQAQKTGLVDGTPLEEWAYLRPAQVAELKAAGVFSVEQCAAMSDTVLPRVGIQARELRDRARQHLQGPNDTEKELRTEVLALRREIDELRAERNMLRQQRDAEEAQGEPSKPKRGRPPKAAT